MRPKEFRYRHFIPEVILQCLRWYLRYPISYRQLDEMVFKLLKFAKKNEKRRDNTCRKETLPDVAGTILGISLGITIEEDQQN